MQNDNEIEQVAQEMANHLVAAKRAEQIAREKLEAETPACPHCGEHRSKILTHREGFRECKKCGSLWGECGYQFIFPAWAQGKGREFRKAFCLMFNIQKEENGTTDNTSQRGRNLTQGRKAVHA